MGDTSAIRNALCATLGADPQLLALMPNGVYYDVAAQGATRFVLVSLEEGTDVATFEGRAIEDQHYLVKAVGLSSAVQSPDDLRLAAKRIDQLLEDQEIPVDGYEWITTHRTQPIDMTEPDGDSRSIRWFHRGGIYRTQFAVVPQGRRALSTTTG